MHRVGVRVEVCCLRQGPSLPEQRVQAGGFARPLSLARLPRDVDAILEHLLDPVDGNNYHASLGRAPAQLGRGPAGPRRYDAGHPRFVPLCLQDVWMPDPLTPKLGDECIYVPPPAPISNTRAVKSPSAKVNAPMVLAAVC